MPSAPAANAGGLRLGGPSAGARRARPPRPAHAWALYLVLVTVGDEHGLSYYGDRSLSLLLSLSEEQIAAARRELVLAELIAYEPPLYQVLALEGGRS